MIILLFPNSLFSSYYKMPRRIQCLKCHVVLSVRNRRTMKNHLKNSCPNRPVTCEVCDVTTIWSTYQNYHGDNCEEKEVSCVFCSHKTTYEMIHHHLCFCPILDEMLLTKYNSKLQLSMFIKLREVSGNMKHAALCDAQNAGMFKLVVENFILRNYDADLSLRLFYCAKQFNFNILPHPLSIYDRISDNYKRFPFAILPDLKFILGDHLTEETLTILNNIKKFDPWLYEKTEYNSFTHSQIIADNVHFTFIRCINEAKRYFNAITEILHDDLNIYVSRMIIDYLIDKSALES